MLYLLHTLCYVVPNRGVSQLMYFVLDTANFLQCKDDLLQSFCHAFTIPSSFSQQIRAFWMLDRGHIKPSMELLLSPRAAVPRLSWQHHCITHCLLTRKQPRLALRYLHWTRPAIESTEDAKLCADVLLQNGYVSEAWALLKRGHTESKDVVVYFLQACNEVAGRPPCPLSAKLYQAQKVSTVSPEELVQLVRKAVMEVRKPHPRTREVMWPEHTERKSNSREMFLSTQALRHLMPSPTPMNMLEETEQTTHTDEPEEERPVQNQQPESPQYNSSSEDLGSESVSSFTSASSLFLLSRERPYVYESTLTLQRISSLLTNGESQSREEEDEEESSRTPSSSDAMPDCSELKATLDGTTDPISLSNLNKEALVELVGSVKEEEENVADVLSSEDFLVAAEPSMNKTLAVTTSNEDSQSVPSACEPQVGTHSFLSPDDEKMACCKGVSEEIVHGPPDVTDLWSSAVSLNQSDCIPYEIFSLSEADTFSCFLEEPDQKTCEHRQQEDTVACFSQGFSGAMSETIEDLLNDPHQSLLSEDPVASSTRASAEMDQWDISLLPPMCSSTQQIFGGSRTSSFTDNIKTTSAPSDTASESSLKAQLTMDEPCVQSTSACLHHQVGSWWKQDCATEPGADNKRPSLVLSQPYSYSLVSFMDFTARQNEDNRDDKQKLLSSSYIALSPVPCSAKTPALLLVCIPSCPGPGKLLFLVVQNACGTSTNTPLVFWAQSEQPG
ncbi:Protein ELYS [Nibea albiflora]|uniref:Protein ELYS n=1 Tax=Nibea albiflora TaxID=240163 RepID=A0ACB7FGL3_NIBAL|nr:Protein ELYS [Nibea albiflora]